MASDRLRFDRFLLDPDDRRLTRDGAPVDLNARYLDALALLARNAGSLVPKERFMEEVWRGVPVTDEALTQCIKVLRRHLGDEAGKPRFIETVPKYGYRFVAPVERMGAPSVAASDTLSPAVAAHQRAHWRGALLIGGAGTLGAGFAGVVGGLFYGFIGASQALAPGLGATSVLLVLLWLCLVVALMGGVGVSLGIAAATLAPSRQWLIVGGALGGLAVGGMVNLLGLDAFSLLLGHSPGDITGAAEGLLIGGAVGLAVFLERGDAGPYSLRRSLAVAGMVGGSAGILVALLGGRMMGGSLESLAQAFPQSRLRLDALGQLVGESGFGTVSQVLSGALEGALFASCIVAAISLTRRRYRT